MAIQEFPVEGREGTGMVARRLTRPVAIMPAVVAHGLRPEPRRILPEHGGKVLAPLVPAVLCHLVIVDGDPVTAEPVPRVAHRGEEEGDPELVRPDMGRLLLNLRHPDGVRGPVEAVEGLRLPAELIPEDEDKVSHVVLQAGRPSTL